MSSTATITLTEEHIKVVLKALRQYRRFSTVGMEVRCLAVELIEMLENVELELPAKVAGTKSQGSGV